MSDRKDKIKNIAIIFLSIMLVLTFFSNTIMNYSLVEVSTQYVYSGSITTKVRGSGTVEAAEGYSVTIEDTRKIESMKVKTGAEVEEGDVLFVLADTDSPDLEAAKKTLKAAEDAYESAVLSSGISIEERQMIESGAIGTLTERQTVLLDAQAEADADQLKCDEIQKKIDKLQAFIDGLVPEATDREDKEKELAQLKDELEKANESLYHSQKYLKLVENLFTQELTLGSLYESVCDAREEVTKLQKESVDLEVKSPMAGTITAINCYAGQTINPETVVMEIKPESEAYTLQFTVSAAQAKRIKAGDQAEILYNWYGNDVNARVQSVRKDPMNRESYIVICEMSGDVSVGDSYTLSIGQQSSNYDYVVPTSCIREDSNGKFILIVEAKSTPLGNRYYARRRDVEVITSDDSQSAIAGALEGYEYVITSTTKPVEENQQVRLAD